MPNDVMSNMSLSGGSYQELRVEEDERKRIVITKPIRVNGRHQAWSTLVGFLCHSFTKT